MSTRVNVKLLMTYELAEHESWCFQFRNRGSQVLACTLPCEKSSEQEDSNSDRAKGRRGPFVRHLRPYSLVVKIVWLTCLTS